ncbi:MAG: hypothetical protein QN183_13765 [Armatimonadota bacterium]|nr:hypothetical protein [Armatimonadota bacterium]
MELRVLSVTFSANDKAVLLTAILRDAAGSVQGTVHFSVALSDAAWQTVQTFLGSGPVRQRLDDLASKFGATAIGWGA